MKLDVPNATADPLLFPAPSAPPPPFHPSDAEFDAELLRLVAGAARCVSPDQQLAAAGWVRLIVQALAVVCMATVACLATVAIVLVFTVKRLQLMIGVLRSETRTEGVRAGLLAVDDAGAETKNGGAEGGGKKKSRRQKTDTNNTSCALEGVDEEDDHRL